MNDETQEGPFDPTNFKVGFDSADPEVMIIQVPIRTWAMDTEHGMALLHGHLREAEAIGARTMVDIRKRRASGGIIQPANGGMGRAGETR